MQKLTDSDVEKLHRLASQGLGVGMLANRFGVHRNTITAHLDGRVAYSPELVLKIGRSPGPMRKAPDQYLTIYQAAALLPDQPSPAKVYRLSTSKVLRTELIERRLYTRLEWVRDCAACLFAPGLYYRSDSLFIYADRTLDLLEALRSKRYKSPYATCRSIAYYPAPTVHAVARALDLRICVPAYRIKLATIGLETVGSYVI